MNQIYAGLKMQKRLKIFGQNWKIPAMVWRSPNWQVNPASKEGPFVSLRIDHKNQTNLRAEFISMFLREQILIVTSHYLKSRFVVFFCLQCIFPNLHISFYDNSKIAKQVESRVFWDFFLMPYDSMNLWFHEFFKLQVTPVI